MRVCGFQIARSENKRIDNQLCCSRMDFIVQKLFEQGNFELILQKIFLSLDGNSLHACALVCKQWRTFILRLFQRKVLNTFYLIHYRDYDI